MVSCDLVLLQLVEVHDALQPLAHRQRPPRRRLVSRHPRGRRLEGTRDLEEMLHGLQLHTRVTLQQHTRRVAVVKTVGRELPKNLDGAVAFVLRVDFVVAWCRRRRG
jgi:hypothetical protein